MSRNRVPAVLAAVALTLGALGGPLAVAADESAKTPAQVIADVQRDLAKVRSFHFAGTDVDPKGTTHLAGDVAASGKADLTISGGSSTARIILLPSAVYLKGNAAYWKANGGAQGPALAKKLAGRWFKTSDAGVRSLVADLQPRHIASCLTVGNGTLKKGGTASVGGRKAVVIVDQGDKPGTAPGKLYASASGRILPLRLQQTGKTRPGGHLDPRCQDTANTSTSSDLRFSAFDKPLHITAPHGAITVPAGGGGGGGTPT
jgi:hypothetical protein